MSRYLEGSPLSQKNQSELPSIPDTFESATTIETGNLFAQELDRNPLLSIREVQGSEGIFNVTILDIRGSTYLFGRKVTQTAPEGQPDAGPLVLAELDAVRNIISVSEIWRPEGKEVELEDPRAHQRRDGTTIGVTVVRSETAAIKTYPGLIELKSPEQLLIEPFPNVRIIERFGGGGQTTPIGGIVEGKNTTAVDEKHIMYRPEGMNHTFQVLECANAEAEHVGFIDFPENIPWAQYKIGTTTPPAWLNDREAFIELHGINIVDGLYVYAIGTARLLRSLDASDRVLFTVDNISQAAIITPDSFPPLTDGRQAERHPGIRRANYNCGAISLWSDSGELIRRELFPSQGDMRTYDAMLAADEIIAGWNRAI